MAALRINHNLVNKGTSFFKCGEKGNLNPVKMNFLKSAFLFFVFLLIFLALTPSTAEAAAILYLSPSTTTASVGQTFSMAIILDTGGSETVGTDVKLNFDATRLEVVSLTNGVIYPTYPSGGKIYDNSAGTIRWSGSATDPANFFSGSGTFGTINFRAKVSGTASVTFDYVSGSTTDTNVVEGGTLAELLTSQPSGGTYIISSGTSGTTDTNGTTGGIGGPTATEGGTATDGASLETGFPLPTILLILLAGFLVSLGGIALATR